MKHENLQSLIAITIATLAVVISIWQGFEQRRHNRLSVKPLLNFETVAHNQTKTIRLSNDGLGPAIIKEFYVTMDGEKIDANVQNPWTPVVENRGLTGQVSQMWYLAESSILKPEKSYNLLSWPLDSMAQLDIQVVIAYESIYQQGFRISEDF